MATLYQLHSSMDMLRRCTDEMSRTWQRGDSILLLGTTATFIDWLNAYLADKDIDGIAAMYALSDDIAQLTTSAVEQLQLDTKLSAILSDQQWVALTGSIDNNHAKFDKVVTIAL